MTEITLLLTYKVLSTREKTIIGQTKVNRIKVKKTKKSKKIFFFLSQFFEKIFFLKSSYNDIQTYFPK